MFCCVVRDPSSPIVPGALEAVARACSPRAERQGDAGIAFDATGLARVIGPPPEIGREVGRVAAEQGLIVRVAIAGSITTSSFMYSKLPRMFGSVMRFMCGQRLHGRTNSTPGRSAVTLSAIEHLVTLPTRVRRLCPPPRNGPPWPVTQL